MTASCVPAASVLSANLSTSQNAVISRKKWKHAKCSFFVLIGLTALPIFKQILLPQQKNVYNSLFSNWLDPNT